MITFNLKIMLNRTYIINLFKLCNSISLVAFATIALSAQPVANTFYQIENDFNGILAKKVDGQSGLSYLSTFGSSKPEKWLFEHIEGNYYYITYGNNCGAVLTETKTEHQNLFYKFVVTIEDRAGLKNQQWQLKKQGDKYQFINRATGNLLAIVPARKKPQNVAAVLKVELEGRLKKTLKPKSYWKLKSVGYAFASPNYIVRDSFLLDYDITVTKPIDRFTGTGVTLDASKWLSLTETVTRPDGGVNPTTGDHEKPSAPNEKIVIPDNVIAYHWHIKKEGVIDETVVRKVDRCGRGLDRPYLQAFILPKEGIYTVQLKIEKWIIGTGDRVIISAEPKQFNVQDILIVSIGDSYASGEGVPDRPGRPSLSQKAKCKFTTASEVLGNIKEFNSTYATWVEPRSHRSNKAGSAIAAKRFMRKIDEQNFVTVTFIHRASSGAEIEKGLLNKQRDWQTEGQIDEVSKIVGDRDIDFLLVSIGGNDIGFSTEVKGLLTPWIFSDKKTRIDAYKRIRDKITKLHLSYQKLDDKIKNTLSVDKVLITEYPPGLFENEEGKAAKGCGLFASNIGFNISTSDAETIKTLGYQLNQAIYYSANNLDWHYVDGIDYRFHKHGYCTQDSYYVGAEESCKKQGDLKGVLHPNEKGQAAYAEAIVAKLKSFPLAFTEEINNTQQLTFQFKKDFPDAWNKFQQPDTANFTERYYPVEFELTTAHFPENINLPTIDSIAVHFKTANGLSPMAVQIDLGGKELIKKLTYNGQLSTGIRDYPDNHWKNRIGASALGKWYIAVPNNDTVWGWFDSGKILDLEVVVYYLDDGGNGS